MEGFSKNKNIFWEKSYVDSELIVLQKWFFYERFPAERGSEKLPLFEANLENYY